ncbi:hypothetical protein MVEG_02446 [Podila verticillata NRRL 6337]|nr:hypothetical protein MVEG_02446 [Podila verticillata NRRL 6337]
MALFLVVSAQAQASEAAQPQHKEHEGDSSILMDTPGITSFNTMIRVPVVDGVALAQTYEDEGSDDVRTTGPWVELDHQAELDAFRKGHINDPQLYSFTAERKAQEEHKADEPAKVGPVVSDKVLFSSRIDDFVAPVGDKAGFSVAKKHLPAWLDFSGMESDLGVLVSFKAAEAEVKKPQEQPVSSEEEKNKDEATKEINKDEQPKKTHPAWLDFFTMDSDLGVVASFKAAVDEDESTEELPKPVSDVQSKDTSPSPKSVEETTLSSEIPEKEDVHATEHQVDTAGKETHPQATFSTPLVQELNQQQHHQNEDEDDTSNGKNVGASVETNRTPLKGQAVLKNRLNKNSDHFDHDETLSDRELEIRKGAIRLGKHHHHHLTSKKSPELESPEHTFQQKQVQEHLQDTSKILLETGEGDLPSSTTTPPPFVVPDTILHGLVPSVLGAHHCTAQFCVNTTLSPDGRFATFHIERDIAATGWISLGIGYAMTMADLIILWPNPTADHPRGAVLSRRTSHAYVEPQLVGHAHAGRDGIKADTASAAELYPENEYTLHNTVPVPEGAVTAMAVFPDTQKFIVQFTRPVKTRNRAFKLTPGLEQDFCWAYSPKPISPDSIADPGAHIAQHFSVGSFAMDVGANQPQLKGVLAQLRAEDAKEEAAEKVRKANELEESNRRLAEQEAAATGGGSGDGGKEEGASEQHTGKVSSLSSLPSSSSSSRAFRGLLSCLTALAVLYFFRS